MEGKQCKETERFSVVAKGSDYFLSLDDKSKQRYEVEINKIQEYDPYQIKKEELQAISVNFHWCSDSLLYIVLLSLSPLTKEELKAYESLESYNKSRNETVFKLPAEITLGIGRSVR